MNFKEEHKDFPKLLEAKEQLIFNVSQEYFDNLPIQIANRIHSTKTIDTFPYFRYTVAILSVFVLVFVAYYHYEKENDSLNVNQITCEDLLNSGYYLEMDESMLLESLSDYEADSNADFDKNELEDYLLQNADESTLINAI